VSAARRSERLALREIAEDDVLERGFLRNLQRRMDGLEVCRVLSGDVVTGR
jgi:hypothetical protein